MMKKSGLFLSVCLIGLLLSGGCRDSEPKEEFRSSLENLLENHAGTLAGKRIGLLTNPTGVDRDLNLIADLLHRDPRFQLTALFAPEHGIRGNHQAGKKFTEVRDPATGLPVYTLYGKHGHRPKPEELAEIDVLVYAIQDIGSRTYTYIWHLAECMSACAAAGTEVVVLDVPNPVSVVDGPPLDDELRSFIGLYPISYTYGLTVGELALYLNTEEKINCRLTVIPMLNYVQGMSWAETGLPWVPTSPQIPSVEAALAYPVTGVIGTLDCVSISIGYPLPFQVVAAPWLDADRMATYLNEQEFEGVRFRPIHFRPLARQFAGEEVHGVQIHFTEPEKVKSQTIGLAMLEYLCRQPEFQWPEPGRKLDEFDRSMGSRKVREQLTAGLSYPEIVRDWEAFNRNFQERSRPYQRYPRRLEGRQ